MEQSDQPLGLALSEGLGPLPATEWVLHMPSRPYEPEWTSSQEGYEEGQMLAYAAAAVAAERQRIAALIAQHSGLTLETLEYLETMRQGPTVEEWAELDRAARA